VRVWNNLSSTKQRKPDTTNKPTTLMTVDQETSRPSTDKGKTPAKSYTDTVKNLSKKMAFTTITSIVEKESSSSVSKATTPLTTCRNCKCNPSHYLDFYSNNYNLKRDQLECEVCRGCKHHKLHHFLEYRLCTRSVSKLAFKQAFSNQNQQEVCFSSSQGQTTKEKGFTSST
jgi:hypothetical protein